MLGRMLAGQTQPVACCAAALRHARQGHAGLGHAGMGILGLDFEACRGGYVRIDQHDVA